MSQLTVPVPTLGKTEPLFTDALAVRMPVFVVEQCIPLENEIDLDDERSWHFVCYSNSGSTPVGTLRIVPPPHAHHEGEGVPHDGDGGHVKVGRFATLKEFRGRGVGRALVDAAVAWLESEGDKVEGWDGRVLAHAQVGVRGVWERLGFAVDERMGVWDEEGIDHCGMWRTVRK
ncbi:acetyltransferase [Tricharina praecox]|uniref:acetyltransferase n=1 Tax=Tricharina praecox TaxID=43433 RepID=UPI00221FB258|nr:acetyltransferase [Tricharina praecox]KAI5850063.1 acetyltransferase [Tricharina praecox]